MAGVVFFWAMPVALLTALIIAGLINLIALIPPELIVVITSSRSLTAQGLMNRVKALT